MIDLNSVLKSGKFGKCGQSSFSIFGVPLVADAPTHHQISKIHELQQKLPAHQPGTYVWSCSGIDGHNQSA